MRTSLRWIGTAGLLLAVLTLPSPALGQKKEIADLQRNVQFLMTSYQDLERKVDDNNAALKTLLEQTLDSVNRMTTSIAAVQKALQDEQANTGARLDTMATQVQSLADNIEELKVRLGKLGQQVGEMQDVVRSLDAKLAGGTPVSAARPAGNGNAAGNGAMQSPPPSSEVLYANALRDYTGGRPDLARQQFEDYLRYYPESDLASNAVFYLGELLFNEGKFRPAVEKYDKVLSYPRSYKLADARYKKGIALLELGDRPAGINELREVIRRHPGSDLDGRARAKLRELGVSVSVSN